jgi:hypothetical protein
MLTTAKSNPRYSTVSVLGNLTPPATPDNSSCHDQPTELSDILSHSRIIAALVPHLLLSDFLNLTMVSRSTRAAVLWHSVPRCSFGLAGGPQTAELEALQHFMVLISLTGRCKSSHKAPVRIGVGACVWCGEGVCQVHKRHRRLRPGPLEMLTISPQSCDVSAYIPFSHRLRRLCSDCYTVDMETSNSLKFVALPETQQRKSKERFCPCRPGEYRICPDCPSPEESGLASPIVTSFDAQPCWVCERGMTGRGGGWFCLWCERRYGEE